MPSDEKPTDKEFAFLAALLEAWCVRINTPRSCGELIDSVWNELGTRASESKDTFSALERQLVERALDDVRGDILNWQRCGLFDAEGLGEPYASGWALHQERLERVRLHADYAQLRDSFGELPWRRQIVILERLGLTTDDDLPLDRVPLFERSYERVLRRGALRHFKIQVSYERDACGLERTTASPAEPLPPAPSK